MCSESFFVFRFSLWDCDLQVFSSIAHSQAGWNLIPPQEHGGEEITVVNPAQFPDRSVVSEYLEPMVLGTILAPDMHMGKIMTLCLVRPSPTDLWLYLGYSLHHPFAISAVFTCWHFCRSKTSCIRWFSCQRGRLSCLWLLSGQLGLILKSVGKYSLTGDTGVHPWFARCLNCLKPLKLGARLPLFSPATFHTCGSITYFKRVFF